MPIRLLPLPASVAYDIKDYHDGTGKDAQAYPGFRGVGVVHRAIVVAYRLLAISCGGPDYRKDAKWQAAEKCHQY